MIFRKFSCGTSPLLSNTGKWQNHQTTPNKGQNENVVVFLHSLYVLRYEQRNPLSEQYGKGPKGVKTKRQKWLLGKAGPNGY